MLWCILETVTALSVLLTLLSVLLILVSDADLLTVFYEKFGAGPESLSGKVVWVTGASSGIGEHLAYQLSEVGCKLVISARREEQLVRVKDACLTSEKCRTQAEDVLVLPLDVAACDTHKEAVDKVLAKFGHIDILVNNAGRGMRGKWSEVDTRVDQELFNLNVLGTVSLTQCVLPHMIARGKGHVAVVSSILGFIQLPLSRAYIGTKHAIQGYFGSLRNEIREQNIDVTLICPGPVKSGFHANQVTSPGKLLGGESSFNEMSTERCAYLSCLALANRMFETWICKNQPLWACYLNQYFPNATAWIMWRFILGELKRSERKVAE